MVAGSSSATASDAPFGAPDHALSVTEKSRWQRLITAQITVLDDSYGGRTAPDAADSLEESMPGGRPARTPMARR